MLEKPESKEEGKTMNPNDDSTDLSALLEKRHETFLEWFEPWTACGPEGNDVDAHVTCRASVHDCINLSRLAARQAGRPTMGDDEAHLLSFMTIHWARVVDKNDLNDNSRRMSDENQSGAYQPFGASPCSAPLTVSLAEAFRVLEECSALSMEDGELFYPSLRDLKGSDENEFAYFQWENHEGLIFSAKFTEGKNQSVTVVNNLMTLVDVEGDEVSFYVLGPLVISDFLSSLSNAQDNSRGLTKN
jgi:hypothetical protein